MGRLSSKMCSINVKVSVDYVFMLFSMSKCVRLLIVKPCRCKRSKYCPKLMSPTLPSPRRRRGKLNLRGRWIGCFPTRPKMGRTTRRLPVALRKMTPSPTTNPLSLQLNNQPDERLLLKQKVPSPFSTTNKEWLHRIGGRQEAEDTKLSSSQCCTPPSPIQQVNKGDKMPQR